MFSNVSIQRMSKYLLKFGLRNFGSIERIISHACLRMRSQPRMSESGIEHIYLRKIPRIVPTADLHNAQNRLSNCFISRKYYKRVMARIRIQESHQLCLISHSIHPSSSTFTHIRWERRILSLFFVDCVECARRHTYCATHTHTHTHFAVLK